MLKSSTTSVSPVRDLAQAFLEDTAGIHAMWLRVPRCFNLSKEMIVAESVCRLPRSLLPKPKLNLSLSGPTFLKLHCGLVGLRTVRFWLRTARAFVLGSILQLPQWQDIPMSAQPRTAKVKRVEGHILPRSKRAPLTDLSQALCLSLQGSWLHPIRV